MKGSAKLLILAIAAMALPAAAQDSPDPNSEVEKLVAARMPEAVILAKIAELAPQLDRSADALIRLQQAGANETVLAAVLSSSSPGSSSVADSSSSSGHDPVVLPPPVQFTYDKVALADFQRLEDEFRVTLALTNQGDIVHQYFSARSNSYTPLAGGCENATLTDSAGNSYACRTASVAVAPAGSFGSVRGANAAPGDTVMITYSFDRKETGEAERFNFAADPFVSFEHRTSFLPTGTQLSATLSVLFRDIRL